MKEREAQLGYRFIGGTPEELAHVPQSRDRQVGRAGEEGLVQDQLTEDGHAVRSGCRCVAAAICWPLARLRRRRITRPARSRSSSPSRRPARSTCSAASSPTSSAAMWGQQVIVENRPGGSGNIGAAAASTAPPDGYTLHFGAQTLAVNVTLSPTTAFDPVTSFEPIMLVATAQEVFTVAVQTPFKSIQDVIAYAKANPGKLNYGSVGIGSSAHLADRAVQRRRRHPDAARALQPDVAGHHRRADRPHRGLVHARSAARCRTSSPARCAPSR